MNPFPLGLRRVTGALTILCIAATAFASATSLATSKYAGSYVATHLNGTNVVRLELLLDPSGRAQLRTGSSRYSQRPTAVGGASTIETGTWHETRGRAVLHIEKYISGTSGEDKDNPNFEDRTFVLSGCELRLIGSGAGFTFDKQHCT